MVLFVFFFLKTPQRLVATPRASPIIRFAREPNTKHESCACGASRNARGPCSEGITAALDEAVEAGRSNDTTSSPRRRESAKDRLRAAIQRAARNTHATKTALAQHLAKEASHLVPLLNGNFTPEEQTAGSPVRPPARSQIVDRS